MNTSSTSTTQVKSDKWEDRQEKTSLKSTDSNTESDDEDIDEEKKSKPTGSPHSPTKSLFAQGTTSNGGFLRSNFKPTTRRPSTGTELWHMPTAPTKQPAWMTRLKKGEYNTPSNKDDTNNETTEEGSPQKEIPVWKKKLLEKKGALPTQNESDNSLPAWKRALIKKQRLEELSKEKEEGNDDEESGELGPDGKPLAPWQQERLQSSKPRTIVPSHHEEKVYDDVNSDARKPEFIKKFHNMNFSKEGKVIEASGKQDPAVVRNRNGVSVNGNNSRSNLSLNNSKKSLSYNDSQSSLHMSASSINDSKSKIEDVQECSNHSDDNNDKNNNEEKVDSNDQDDSDSGEPKEPVIESPLSPTKKVMDDSDADSDSENENEVSKRNQSVQTNNANVDREDVSPKKERKGFLDDSDSDSDSDASGAPKEKATKRTPPTRKKSAYDTEDEAEDFLRQHHARMEQAHARASQEKAQQQEQKASSNSHPPPVITVEIDHHNDTKDDESDGNSQTEPAPLESSHSSHTGPDQPVEEAMPVSPKKKKKDKDKKDKKDKEKKEKKVKDKTKTKKEKDPDKKKKKKSKKNMEEI